MAPPTRSSNSLDVDDNSPLSSSHEETRDSPGLAHILTLLVDRLEARDQRVSEPSDNFDIEKFNGRNRNHFRNFMQQIDAALLERPRYFREDKVRVTFVGRHLSELTLSWYLSSVANSSLLNNWIKFKEEFSKAFGNPDEKADADRKLQKIRMGSNEDCMSYITRFREIQSILQWPDEPLMSAFRRGLSGKIRDDLGYNRTKPETLAQLMELSLESDLRHRENAAYSEADNPSSNSNNRSNKGKRSPGHISSSTSGSGSRSANANSTANGTTQVKSESDKPSYLTADNKLTAEEKKRRVDNGLCLYCGKGRHKLEDCYARQKNAGRSFSALAESGSTSSTRESNSNVDSSSSASSKNE